jgi:hypothetical protein
LLVSSLQVTKRYALTIARANLAAGSELEIILSELSVMKSGASR